MKRRFEVLSGAHMEGGRLHKQGDVVVSSHRLTKLFPERFKDLGLVDDEDEVPTAEKVKKVEKVKKPRAISKAPPAPPPPEG